LDPTFRRCLASCLRSNRDRIEVWLDNPSDRLIHAVGLAS